MFDPSSVKPLPAGSLTAEFTTHGYNRLSGYGKGVALVGAYEHKFNRRPPIIGVERAIRANALGVTTMYFTLWAGVGEQALYFELDVDDLSGTREFCESLTEHGYEEVDSPLVGNVRGWRLKS